MNRRSFMAALAATLVPAKASPVPLWHPARLSLSVKSDRLRMIGRLSDDSHDYDSFYTITHRHGAE